MQRLACFAVATTLLLTALLFCSLGSIEAEVLESSQGARWYRGNMHTHSLWSDGDDFLESIGSWYRDQKYQFLVFTDHNVIANTERWVEIDKLKGGRESFEKLKKQFPDWVEVRTQDGKEEVRLRRFDEVSERLNVPGEFLLIQGEELSDKFEKYPIHINASNVKEVIQPRHGNSVFEVMQNNVDAVLAQRHLSGEPILVHLNHPNFHYAITAEEMMRLQGEKFFEVYNGHPSVYNHGDHTHYSTERIWDIVLAHRLGVLGLPIMYGLANDDGHHYQGEFSSKRSNPGRGWVMALASKLTAPALIEALEAGRFYASSGVDLARVETSKTGMLIEIQPVDGETYTIDFIGTRKGTSLEGTPVVDEAGKPVQTTHQYSDKVGEVFKSVSGTRGEYRFIGDELYVRATITSSAKHPNPSAQGDFKQAWAQPIPGPGISVPADQ